VVENDALAFSQDDNLEAGASEVGCIATLKMDVSDGRVFESGTVVVVRAGSFSWSHDSQEHPPFWATSSNICFNFLGNGPSPTDRSQLPCRSFPIVLSLGMFVESSASVEWRSQPFGPANPGRFVDAKDATGPSISCCLDDWCDWPFIPEEKLSVPFLPLVVSPLIKVPVVEVDDGGEFDATTTTADAIVLSFPRLKLKTSKLPKSFSQKKKLIAIPSQTSSKSQNEDLTWQCHKANLHTPIEWVCEIGEVSIHTSERLNLLDTKSRIEEDALANETSVK
jgi:hypothetical protein